MRESPITDLAQAIQSAINAESDAIKFYDDAAKKSIDPRGRDMFEQLMRFEKAHFISLRQLLDSLNKNPEVHYEGTAFDRLPPGVPRMELLSQYRQTDIDALNIAIEAEKKANAAYTRLAAQTADSAIKNFFAKLAEEEDLHRMVLEDQFFALANKGYWTWGE